MFSLHFRQKERRMSASTTDCNYLAFRSIINVFLSQVRILFPSSNADPLSMNFNHLSKKLWNSLEITPAVCIYNKYLSVYASPDFADCEEEDESSWPKQTSTR
jgi:hypothetical protein